MSGSNTGIFAIILAGAGTPVLPTSVVWDPAGANQALTLVQQATFNTNFIAATYAKIGPTSGTAKFVRATWAAAPDEGLLIAESVQDMDQATGWRTPDTPGAGNANTNPTTATLAATSVSGDLVLALMAAGCLSSNISTLSSSTVTIHDKLEGADGSNNEALSVGSVIASGAATTVSADIVNAAPGTAAIFWEQFALSIMSVASGPTIDTQPADVVANTGTTANYTVAATTSGGSLTYQWQVSTNRGASYSNVSDGSGGTTTSYTTHTIVFADEQTFYRCAVTDSNGTTNTRGASLRIITVASEWLYRN